MKNRIVLAALAALTLFSGTAFAGGVLRFDRLAWKFPANVTSAPYTQQTKALAAGGTDTTVWISTAGWYVPENGVSDSVLVARFIVFVDSSAAYAPGQTSLSVAIDGALSPQAGGLPNVNFHTNTSLTILPTTGDKVMQVPIFITPAELFGGPSSAYLGAWRFLPPFIRMRFSSSAAINAAGVAVQYMTVN